MDGYGYAGIQIAQAIKRMGLSATMIDVSDNGKFPTSKQEWVVDETAVVLTVPEFWELVKTPRLIGYTMFECTSLPEGWVEAINRYAQKCIVPCQWCLDSFAEQGVAVPIEIVRLGINSADYYPILRQHEGQPYTFLWSGTGDLRKGWDVAYKAFMLAFGDRSDVKLKLHFREMPLGVVSFDDPNVEVVAGKLPLGQLRELLQSADCFVFPSRGEGWGLPPREAAATGLPVIATDCTGLSEEIEQWAMPLQTAGRSIASYGCWMPGEIGEWAKPDVDHLVYLMRWCESHRQQAETFGMNAAFWLADNTPWERTALGLAEAVCR